MSAHSHSTDEEDEITVFVEALLTEKILNPYETLGPKDEDGAE